MRGKFDGALIDSILFNDFEINENDGTVPKQLEINTNGTNIVAFDTNLKSTFQGDVTILGTLTAGFTNVNAIQDADDTTSIETEATAETITFTTNSLNRGQFKSDGDFNLSTGGTYQINDIDILNNLTLGSSVINSSLTNLGTLTALTVNNDMNITTGNAYQINGLDILSSTGLASSVVNSFLTSVGTLTSLTMGGNIAMGTNDITGATNITATNLTGTLQTVAQPNITSVGTLTALTVDSDMNITTGNTYQINGIGVLSAISLSTSVLSSGLTSVGTLSSLTMGGDIAMGTNDITGATNITATNLTGTLQTVAQTNITSVGILTGLTVATTGTAAEDILTLGGTSGSADLRRLQYSVRTTMFSGDTHNWSTATGSGIMTWDNATTEKMRITDILTTISNPLDLPSGNEYRINAISVLSATTLGSNIVNSSLTNLGILTALRVNNDIGINTAPSGLGGAVIHVHNTGGTVGSFAQFTNAITGATTNDGFAIGIDGSEQAELRMRENADMNFYTNNALRMSVQSFGDVEIGNSLSVGFTPGTSPSVALAIGQTNKGLVNSGTDMLAINVAGNEVVNFQSVSAAGSSIADFSSSDPNIECIIFGDGDIENTNGNYGTLSDERIKENIVNATSQWDDIKAINFKKYSLIREDTNTQTKLGVLAQELEIISPNLVKTGTRKVYIRDENDEVVQVEGEYKSVKQSILYMKGLVALQEAQTRIETLETENTTLQTQMAAILARLDVLESFHIE